MIDVSRKGGWIQTFTGKQIWPLDPRPDEIDVLDIAHALANTCRYGGHSLGFYSVAQHSVYVSRICKPEHALDGLLHDAAEAYLGDIPRPIKHGPGMDAYLAAEVYLEEMIALKYNVCWPVPDDVKWADSALLATEKRDLLRRVQVDEVEWLHGAPSSDALSWQIVPYNPDLAEAMFLDRYRELMGGGLWRTSLSTSTER